MINHICFTSRTEYIQRRSLAILKLKNNSNISHTCCRKKESTCKLKSANSSEQLCKLRLPRIAPIQFRWRMCKGIKRYNVRTIIKSTSKQKFGQENNAVKADEAICLILDYFTIISIALLHNMQVMVHRPICGFNERPTPPPVEDNFVIGERSSIFPGSSSLSIIIIIEICLRSFKDLSCEFPCYL